MEGSGLDARRGRVGFGVGAQLMAQTQIEVAGTDEAGIRGPQAGQRLADVAERLLHGARAHAERAFGKASVTVALREDLEERDGIGDRVEERRDVQLGTESFPDGPGPILGGNALRNLCGASRCLRKAEVSAKCIAGGR